MYNPYSLEDKTILVAGASSGIGRELAIECSKLGALVHIVGRNSEKLSETLSLMQEGGHEYHVCDITNEDKLDILVEKMPVLDGFVNCVGIAKVMLMKFLNKKSLNEIIETNAVAPISLMQKLVRRKKFSKKSSTVFVSSLSGVYTVHYGDALNATSKGAINAFVKSAALDLAAQGIRVNCVNPGVVATDAAFAGTSLTKEEMEAKQQFFPLKRFGQPKDVALAIIYFLSDASTWITGVDMPIDGGYTLL